MSSIYLLPPPPDLDCAFLWNVGAASCPRPSFFLFFLLSFKINTKVEHFNNFIRMMQYTLYVYDMTLLIQRRKEWWWQANWAGRLPSRQPLFEHLNIFPALFVATKAGIVNKMSRHLDSSWVPEFNVSYSGQLKKEQKKYLNQWGLFWRLLWNLCSNPPSLPQSLSLSLSVCKCVIQYNKTFWFRSAGSCVFSTWLV